MQKIFEEKLEEVEILIKKRLISLNNYDESWFNLHYNRFIETHEILKKYIETHNKILDVGCSPLYFTIALKKTDYDVYGIDYSIKEIIEQANRHNIIIKECDLNKDKIPFGNCFFDGIIFTEVIEHLNYVKIPFVLSEIKRITKHNGYVIISTPNIAALENRLLLLLGKQIIRSDHNRIFTLTELLKLIREQGFNIVEYHYSLSRDTITHVIPDKIISRKNVLRQFIKYPCWKNIGRALTLPFKYIIPSFRSCIFIVAKKSG